MALSRRSSFLYGYTVTASNNAIDFVAEMGGDTISVTIPLGDYSLSDLLIAITQAMQGGDPDNAYIITADRSINGGTENLVTIMTTGSYLDLLFASGPQSAMTIAPLIGFNSTDYTGDTEYTGSNTTGTLLIPTLVAYNYLGTANGQQAIASRNISALGVKETIVYSIQNFFQAQFKYEPFTKVENEWQDYFIWAIQQKPFDFTPEITAPNTVYNCTLERTTQDPNGLAYQMDEMLPDFPNLYDTGLLLFRLKVN